MVFSVISHNLSSAYVVSVHTPATMCLRSSPVLALAFLMLCIGEFPLATTWLTMKNVIISVINVKHMSNIFSRHLIAKTIALNIL